MQFSNYLLSLIAGAVISTSCLAAAPSKSLPQVEIKTTLGDIVVELDPEAAPKTVKNFLQYVKSGFYDGTIFHRVIDNFMIQGGGMDKDMKEKKTNPPIVSEAKSAFDHGLTNKTGTIAMARKPDPDSATSQFYINVNDNTPLDTQPIAEGDPVQIKYQGNSITVPRAQALPIVAGYTPFGRVIDGMSVVNKIKAVETQTVGGNANVPKKPITIISAKILEKNIAPK